MGRRLQAGRARETGVKAGMPQPREGAPGAQGTQGTAGEASAELNDRCNAIEECYEFMLAYAAQGLPSDEGSASGAQIREYLRRCDTALVGLAEFLNRFAERLNVEPAAPYRDFLSVLDRDSRDAQATLRLVLAQPSISSQLIDNLNASIHLRALLTDLFLIDEILKAHRRS
jgi:hypothetical protein